MCCADLFIDDLIRIAVIWSSSAVFLDAIAEVATVSLGLNQYLMTIYGCVGCLLMSTLLRELAVNAIEKTDNDTLKVTLEQIYVGVSAVTCVMLWQGIGCYTWLAARSHHNVLYIPYIFIIGLLYSP